MVKSNFPSTLFLRNTFQKLSILALLALALGMLGGYQPVVEVESLEILACKSLILIGGIFRFWPRRHFYHRLLWHDAGAILQFPTWIRE